MSNDYESDWHITSNKTDEEQFEWMLEYSHDAQACFKSFKDGKLLEHAQHLIDLVKMGYTRQELNSFLRIMYDQSNK
jgi:hypothetical protein